MTTHSPDPTLPGPGPATAAPQALPTAGGGRRLVGVGVGPGDAELVTLKAQRTFAEADVVLVPATERSGEGPGRAEEIVATVAPQARIRRVPFSMADRQGVTARRRQAWETSAAAAVEEYRGGAAVVCFATVGDPSVYSTFSYLAAYVTAELPDVEVEVVPGITAMQALAAASRTPLCEGQEVLALAPATAGIEVLDAVLDACDTVVVYKGGSRLPEVVDVLRRHDREAVMGTDIGLPAEQVVPLAAVTDGATAPYFSTVLSAPRRARTGGRL
ncbi:precorrin-2 C20-methyltransferase /cobalt-factor II C20-methyltransferase [Raineyella antarctica]|uniref:Precorrin-2 C20-methyltransferase /cobalt-factor II C20-methyltransferase n=1 Tax=Raineyella antarctica TaxID=1577474 RepID=A0A1G6GDE7_9ACTN|nr:precorrin-2 C(20)-methyltransferase [Raineyella antarctica]SDB79939.1 precorrin-2 C20-methyltransferase /cobalt-factor II C20-methyltransferase [Raineyella antarctica]